MRKLLLAISFLTIIPAYGNRLADEKELAGSLAFYPLVGFLIGSLLAGMAALHYRLALGLSGDALIIVVWIITTAGLHLDGLMDTADGLFCGQDREGKLEVMRDSRVGAMGVITLMAVLILKLAFLNSLSYADKMWILAICPAFGRGMMVLAIYIFPYARSGGGLGRSFAEQAHWVHILIALLTLAAVTFGLGGSTGLILLGLAIIPVAIVAGWTARQLGGLTGDNYGAIGELSETIWLITAVIWKALA